ncbi:hypothetical protein [Pseudomonas syringae pv. coryli]|uniref:hypothetical protein n=1 Tax=Pseudomonas syringae pv. coryli TaxID=317659 RepID=UPI003D2D4388
MKQATMTSKKQPKALQLCVAVFGMFAYQFAMAAGGLDEATNQANEIKTWAYGFLGVGVFLYLIYNVIMALLDKKPWADVLVATAYVGVAGAVLVLGDWAWGIWGS